MLLGTLLDGGRVRRMGLVAGAGLLALGLSVPASVAVSAAQSMPSPLMPVPDPPAPSATGTPTVPATTPAPVVVPDRVDRQWPKNPPWDACPRPVWPGELSSGMPGGGRRVLVIGDSLTRESLALTAKGMRRNGWTPTFRCWGSRRGPRARGPVGGVRRRR